MNKRKYAFHCVVTMFCVMHSIKTELSFSADPIDKVANCRSVSGALIEAGYEEWPFKLNCTQIFDEGITEQWIENVSYSVWKAKNITISKVKSRSCVDDITHDVSHNVNLIETSMTKHSSVILPCQPTEKHIDEAIFPPANSTEVWKRSKRRKDDPTRLQTNLICRNTPEKIFPAKTKTNFKISTADYTIPGVYSCKVKYKGKRAFVAHYSICVKNILTRGRPVINCNSLRTSFTKSQSIILDCDVFSSNGAISSNDIEVLWKKQKDGDGKFDEICSLVNTTADQVSLITPTRISCGLLNFHNYSIKCFSHEPENKELVDQKERNKFRISLRISDAQAADVGNYFVQLRYRTTWANSTILRVDLDASSALYEIIYILVASLVAMLVVAACTFVVWYNHIQILLFLRRHFGSYDEEQKQYVVYFSYCVSGDSSQMDLNSTKKILCWLKELVKEENHSFYDSYEHFQPGYTPEVVLANLSRSHRAVLVLTPSYIADHNSRFLAHQAYKRMLDNQIKLIVITTPCFDKALRESIRGKQQFSLEIREAIKASRKITWTEATSKTRFKNKVRYALPYLERSKDDTPLNNL